MKSTASIPREPHCRCLVPVQAPRPRLFCAAVLLCLLPLHPWTLPARAQVSGASLETPGISILTPDRSMFADPRMNEPNWQPRTTVLGDETLVLAANGWKIEADLESSPERTLVAFVSKVGAVTEEDGFFYDNGAAWEMVHDIAHHNNPPCVAGDKRDGGKNYLLGSDCTPWAFPGQFPTFSTFWTTGIVWYDTRWRSSS